ncbi:MAG: ImmA/IrrE family metallo-endopeptidase [Flavobacteriales bacterium]|nr:ImmA/IrrE family metallo-endopeptidase [Flavobacteriales bacterium]
MKQLKFHIEWEDPLGARGEELAATWASLRITVGDVCVTRLSSLASSNSIRESVQMPLYPLAEWLTYNWWHLRAEMQGAAGRMESNGLQSFWKRHNLRAAQEGFSLPDLSILPMGASEVKLEWQAGHLEFQEVRFIESGMGYCDAQQVTEELERFINAVTDRLSDRGIKNSALQTEWDSVLSADREERDFCLVAAGLGLDPYSMDESGQDELIEAADKIGTGILRDEFFAVADGRSILRQTNELVGIFEEIDSVSQNVIRLSGIKDRVNKGIRRHDVEPWKMGYAFARGLREQMNGHGKDVFGSHLEILEALSLGEKDADSLVVQRTFNIPISGAVAVNSADMPVIALRQGEHSDQQKFNFCRGLYEFLIGGKSTRRVITSARTETQKESRAFAAEFLVPSELLRADVTRAILYEEDVDLIAHKYSVSSYVIRHQITNHRIAELVID